jgi:hypothetical protein
MDSAEQIAAEYESARRTVEYHVAMNVAGLTFDERVKASTEYMRAIRQFNVANSRREAWIRAGLQGDDKMNQIEAFKETLEFVRGKWQAWDTLLLTFIHEHLSFAHHEDMLRRILENPEAFSEAKFGRWLGWLQGVAAAHNFITLDQCKAINKRWA